MSFPPDTGREPAALDPGDYRQFGRGSYTGGHQRNDWKASALKAWGAFDRYPPKPKDAMRLSWISALLFKFFAATDGIAGVPRSRVAADSDPDHPPAHLKGDQP
jgi:hypothetical protein